jgi:hypothetical protein
MGRNIGLPDVRAKGDKPFVFATRFPNGAVAIAAQERTQVGNAWYMPAAKVLLDVSDAPGPFGVFGYFDELTLVLDRPFRGKRVLAQDLAGEKSQDISDEVEIRGTNLRIPGTLINEVGLQKGSANDVSAPGMMIAIV